MLFVTGLAEVARYLQGTGRTVRRFTAEDGDGYLFEVRREGASQLFGARALSWIDGGSWLALTVRICPAARLDLRRTLVANGALSVGALSVSNANALLRQTLPLSALRVDHLETTIVALAAQAAMLQAAADVPANADTNTPFSYAFR